MNRLKELREAKKWTKQYVADLSKLPRVTISYLESGKRPMRIQHAEALAPIFNVSVDYILGSDAIYYASSFEGALKNLLDEMFDSVVSASSNDTASTREKRLYAICQKILELDDDLLGTLNSLVNTLVDR